MAIHIECDCCEAAAVRIMVAERPGELPESWPLCSRHFLSEFRNFSQWEELGFSYKGWVAV